MVYLGGRHHAGAAALYRPAHRCAQRQGGLQARRGAADASKPYEERLEIRRRALLSDLFITGVNAVTEQGTLHWLDKVGNRIAPVAFGPRKVIIVAGRNKIVADRDEAEERIRRIAAPQNVARHPGFRTPCAKTGVCADCNSQDRICNTRMEMLRCWPDKRVLVILIDEDSGL